MKVDIKGASVSLEGTCVSKACASWARTWSWGTSRSKSVSEGEIAVGSKCLPNRCPARERPLRRLGRGLDGVCVHVDFEGMQVGVKDMGLGRG